MMNAASDTRTKRRLAAHGLTAGIAPRSGRHFLA